MTEKKLDEQRYDEFIEKAKSGAVAVGCAVDNDGHAAVMIRGKAIDVCEAVEAIISDIADSIGVPATFLLKRMYRAAKIEELDDSELDS